MTVYLIPIAFLVIWWSLLMFLLSLGMNYVIFKPRGITPYFNFKTLKKLNPADYGLNDAQHIWLYSSAGRIGAWYLECPSAKASVLYLHGQKYDRSSYERVIFMRVLCELGLSVMSLDYRGYGDSDGHPSELGVIEDATVAYEKLRSLTPGKPICIWGHSLGSCAATHLASNLCESAEAPAGLILESPIDSVFLRISSTKIGQLFLGFPYYGKHVERMAMNSFNNLETIHKITCRILLAHAVGDPVVMETCSTSLYEAYKQKHGENGLIEHFEFHSAYRHSYLFSSPKFHQVLRSYINKICKEFKE